MRRIWSLGLLAALALPATGREPPAPHCIDGRAIAEAHQIDAQTLLLRDTRGDRRQLTLADACPGLLDDSAPAFVGWDGWLCGRDGEAVRAADRACPVASVAPVDARDYAALLRDSRQAMRTLDRVVVQDRRARGFRGTPDYCVASRWLRSWHDGPQGLEVEVSPRQAAGHRRYRIELQGQCDTDRADTLNLVSGMGTGVVCGHAGGHAVFSRSTEATDPSGAGFMRTLGSTGAVARTRCQVTRVYPLER